MKTKIVLTNWQVPKDPKLARFEALNAAKPIDMANYENVGSVEHHDSVESVAAKMMKDYEAKTGRPIPAEAPQGHTLNMAGVKDTSGIAKPWKPGDPFETHTVTPSEDDSEG